MCMLVDGASTSKPNLTYLCSVGGGGGGGDGEVYESGILRREREHAISCIDVKSRGVLSLFSVWYNRSRGIVELVG